MRKIVFIDDDLESMDLYIDACEAEFPNYEIKHFFQPEEAEVYILENKTDIDLIILDIMFVGDESHKGGINKGIEYYYIFKDLFPDNRIFVLTNRTLDEEKISKLKIDVDNNNDIIYEKPDALISAFFEIVKPIIEE